MAHQRIWMKKKNNELGIVVTRFFGDQNPIHITQVKEDGPAYQEGCLEVGDEIFKINGESLIGIPYDQATDIIKQSGDLVEVEVAKRDPTMKERRNKSSRSEEHSAHDLGEHQQPDSLVQQDYTEPPPPTTPEKLRAVTNVPGADPVPNEPTNDPVTMDVMLQLILFLSVVLIYFELLTGEVARVYAETI